MEGKRAIPEGYMTVGAVAKKMHTTVRTLQYYDKEGLLSPSAESEGGRRLYTNKDVLKLHQILSMKSLGFSLSDIKHRLRAINTPADMATMLREHAAAIREKVETLSNALGAIEALETEVLQMETVDFERYADIIGSLQKGNENYWMLKHFDKEFMDHVRKRFGDLGDDLGIMDTHMRLLDEAIRLQGAGVPPESEQAQVLAKEFWDMILAFTGGDMSLLPKMLEMERDVDKWDDKAWKQKQVQANQYFGEILDVYFENQGYNPFEEVQQP
ncbi:MAG: MerR family transcriptional regulator [Oscillospiraceae bacterium]|nr:MerR family transcriptional regulator [Oscillospiraceae bacterium]